MQTWEAVERNTRFRDSDGKFEISYIVSMFVAVCILAVTKSLNTHPEIILVRQFRAPIGKWVLEMPAGLIDEGETPSEAAIRELEEETGYVGTGPHTIGPIVFNDPGLTNANVNIVRLTVS